MNSNCFLNLMGGRGLACLSLLFLCGGIQAQNGPFFSISIVSFSPSQVVLAVNTGGRTANLQTSPNGVNWTTIASVIGSGIYFDDLSGNVTNRFYRGVAVDGPGESVVHIPGFIRVVIKPGLNAVVNQLAPGSGIAVMGGGAAGNWGIYGTDLAGTFALPAGLSVQKVSPSGTYDTYYIEPGQPVYSPTFAPGEAFLVNNPATNVLHLYLLGDAPGLTTNFLPAGWSLCGTLSGNFHELSNFPAQDGDEIYRISPTNGQIEAYAIYFGNWFSPSDCDGR